MGQWEDFINDLKVIEAAYWQYFRHTALSDHYILNEDENRCLRFGFKKNSDLCPDIKKACLDVFRKYQSNIKLA
jgi:hypothetical protein